MQIPQIGRKTIDQMFRSNSPIPSTINEVRDFFVDSKYYNTSIRIPEITDIEKAYEKAKNIYEKSLINNIKMITVIDEKFPKKLKYIPDPPVVFFYKGNYDCILENNSVAIIGTREPTEHGMKIAERLGTIFGELNFVVVSGLAIGCDTFGHKGCVNAKGRSIAVMPGGLDNIYPSKNKYLAESILDENGCLLSEYPVGVRPFKTNFVDRDRLQSGLSMAVIVIETDVKGGTMHTVKFSQEQKRILACYSHPEKYLSEKQTKGNQLLIKEKKAIPIKNEDDIKHLIEKIKKHNLESFYDASLENKSQYFQQMKIT
jgi:DNA processing protein